MTGTQFLFSVLLLFLVIAIGHDLYLAYFTNVRHFDDITSIALDPYAFKLSDLGFFWETYHPASLNAMRSAMDESSFKFVDFFLGQPTVLLIASPIILLLFVKIFFSLKTDDKKIGKSKKPNDLDIKRNKSYPYARK